MTHLELDQPGERKTIAHPRLRLTTLIPAHKSHKNKQGRISKVQKLLEIPGTVNPPNVKNLDQMFNLELNVVEVDESTQEVDKSEKYLFKILQLREAQKKILPLYLESKSIVSRHQNCLQTIINDDFDYIPSQLQQVIDKGSEGLSSYQSLLDNIDKVIQRNSNLIEQLQRYQQSSSIITKKQTSVN